MTSLWGRGRILAGAWLGRGWCGAWLWLPPPSASPPVMTWVPAVPSWPELGHVIEPGSVTRPSRLHLRWSWRGRGGRGACIILLLQGAVGVAPHLSPPPPHGMTSRHFPLHHHIFPPPLSLEHLHRRSGR